MVILSFLILALIIVVTIVSYVQSRMAKCIKEEAVAIRALHDNQNIILFFIVERQVRELYFDMEEAEEEERFEDCQAIQERILGLEGFMEHLKTKITET